MNFKNILGATLVASAVAMASSASAQVPSAPVNVGMTPGIVMAGSYDVTKLPEAAHKFLKKHFPVAKVVKCEQYYAKGKVEVELDNGVDVDFDLKGQVLEVDAPDGTYISDAILRDLLHKKAYDRLAADGYAGRVESLEFKKGRVVEVDVNRPDPDTYVFDLNGVLLMMED